MLFESHKAANAELSTDGPLRGGQNGEQLFGQNRNGLHAVHGGRNIVRGRGREEEESRPVNLYVGNRLPLRAK